MQHGISQTPNLALAAGELGFSGGSGKGHGRPQQITVLTLPLPLTVNEGFVHDGCLGGRLWHHLIVQVASDSKMYIYTHIYMYVYSIIIA